MKKKKMSSVTILFLLFLFVLKCNAQTGMYGNVEHRAISLKYGFGFPEYYSLGVGFQLTPYLELSAKMNAVYHPDMQPFILPNYMSIKVAYYLRKRLLFLNNIGVTFGKSQMANDKATLLEFSIGDESIGTKIINYYVSFGVSVLLPEHHSTQILPSIIGGMNINL